MTQKPALFSLFIIVLLILGAYLLAPGSNPYAQEYTFNVSQKELIGHIITLKSQLVDQTRSNDMSYDQMDSFGTYHAYLWIPKERQTAHISVERNREDSTKSSILLIGFADNPSTGEWKLINKDFKRTENLQKKNSFELQFLNPLSLPYQNIGNSMFIFWK